MGARPLRRFLNLDPLSLSRNHPPPLPLGKKKEQGRRDGSTPDEPFAWASREFLRRLAIGRQCTFRVDSTAEATGRAFGAVFLSGDDKDLSARVAAAGWARVKPHGASSSSSSSQQQGGSSSSTYHEELVAASAAAEAAGKGIFARSAAAGGGGGGGGAAPAVVTAAAADAVAASASGPLHFSPPGSGVDAEAAAEALLAAAGGRGSKLRGIVEYVSSGSSLRATLFAPTKSGLSRGGVLPARGVPLILAGAVCPSMTATAPKPPSATADASAPPAPPVDPYAPVARHFSEARLLHRDCAVTLLGLDKHGNLVASISASAVPPPSDSAPASLASIAAASEDIALSLVRAGLARAAEWGLAMLPSPAEATALRDAERAAKSRRAGFWKNWSPPAGAAAKSTGSFRGLVAEVVSGDVLVIRDDASGGGGGGGVERRLCLSSTRAPRLGRRDPATGKVEGGEPFAAEAKEFLRSRLIGRAVEVKLEYERKVPIGAGGAGGGERLLSFAAVSLPPSSADGAGAGKGGANVAELLLSRGLATVARHRADDERASGYDALIEAEAAAKAKRRGVHGLSEGGAAAAAAAKNGGAASASAPASAPAPQRVNDVSGPGSAARAKAYLPSFTRSRSVQAVVEHVLSGHRLKLSVPKESVVVAFALANVRVSSSNPAAPNSAASSAAANSDPIAAEAVALVRRVALQRDVEVEVEACDRGGTFLGTLRVPDASSPSSSIDLATLLVRVGLAKVTPLAAADGGPRVEALLAAQREAQQARRGSWRDWDPAAEAAAEAEAAAAASAAAGDGDLLLSSTSPSKPFERISVVVTDVRSFDDISVQMAGEPRVSWIASTLSGAALDVGGTPLGGVAARGSLVAAKFSADGQWYRARVDAAAPDGGARVTFVDFGNSEALPPASLRGLPAELAAPPPQALAAKLALVRRPPSASRGNNDSDDHGGDDDDGGDEFSLAASDLVASALGGGAPLEALVVSRNATAGGGGPGRALSLIVVVGGSGGGDSDAGDQGGGDEGGPSSESKEEEKREELSTRDAVSKSVNAELLRAGLLRLDRPRLARSVSGNSSSSVPAHLSEALSSLEEAQDAARRGRRGIWEYGDPGGDSDDDERRGGGGGRGGTWGARR